MQPTEQGQRPEHIRARADAAVHQHGDAALHRRHDLRQHLCRGRAAVQHPAAVVGHQDGVRSGLQGLESALDGHNALDDEGQSRSLSDLAQLLHGLAACRRVHALQEGQARRVHVHGHGKGPALPHQSQLLPDELHIPGLDGGHAHAAHVPDGLGGLDHDVGIQAVAGEGRNARLGAAADQGGIVGLVIVFIAVVHGDSPHRACKNGGGKGSAEEGEGGIRLAIGAEGIHIHPQPLPGIVVPDRRIPHALGPWAGDRIPASLPIADGAGLTLPHAALRLRHYFLISHDVCTILMYFCRRHYSTEQGESTDKRQKTPGKPAAAFPANFILPRPCCPGRK